MEILYLAVGRHYLAGNGFYLAADRYYLEIRKSTAYCFGINIVCKSRLSNSNIVDIMNTIVKIDTTNKYLTISKDHNSWASEKCGNDSYKNC